MISFVWPLRWRRRGSTLHGENDKAKRRALQDARNASVLATDDLAIGLGARTARGGAAALVMQGCRLVFQLGSTAILARLLAPEDFGLMAMAMTVMAFAGMFTDFGLSAATVQRPHLDQNTVSGLWFLGIGLSLIVMISLLAISPFAAAFFGDPRVAPIIAATAATMPVSAASAQHLALLQRRMRFWTINIIQFCAMALAMTITVTLIWLTDIGYWGLVLNGWLSTLFCAAAIWTVSPWRPSVVKSWRNVKQCVNFGAYLTGFALSDNLLRQSDNVLIGWRYAASDLGYYTRAYGLLMLPMTSMVYPLVEIAKASLSRVTDDPARFERLFHILLLPLNLGSSALAGALYLLSSWLVIFLFGDQWGPSVPLFQALSLSIAAQTISFSMNWIYLSTGRGRDMFVNSLIASVTLTCIFFVTTQISLLAVAIGYSCATITLTPVLCHLAMRRSAVAAPNFIAIQLPPPLAALGAVLAVTAIGLDGPTNLVDALFTGSAFVALYAAGLLLTCAVSVRFRRFAVELQKTAMAHLPLPQFARPSSAA